MLSPSHLGPLQCKEAVKVRTELSNAIDNQQSPPALAGLTSEDGALQAKKAAKVAEIRKLEQQLKHLSAQKGDSLAKYGQDAQKMAAAIKRNEHKFHHPPVGPVGSHIKMREGQKESTSAVEIALGRKRLHTVLVHNWDDLNLMKQLMRQEGINMKNIPIEKRKLDQVDFKTSGRLNLSDFPDKRIKTVHQVIVVEHTAILNYLHDEQVYKIGIVRTRKEAMELQWHQHPRNLMATYDQTGSKFIRKEQAQAEISAKLTTENSGFLGSDVTEMIRGCELHHPPTPYFHHLHVSLSCGFAFQTKCRCSKNWQLSRRSRPRSLTCSTESRNALQITTGTRRTSRRSWQS